MSLINKMLQDLDRRHAPQEGARAGGLAQHVRAVPSRAIVSDYFWRVMALAMLFAVGWVAWLVWQLAPQSVVTDLAYESTKKSPLRKETRLPPADAAVVPPAPNSQAVASAPQARGIDMLRLATELTTPIPKRSTRPSPRAASKKSAKATQRAALPDKPAALASGKIERHSNSTPVERAESEFRRAVTLVNQGRIAEGMEGLHTVLKIDPGHEVARQTLVALLLEARRVDDAAGVLEEGLAVNTENTGFAMLLARIMVERNDVAGALAVLQRHAAPPDRNADFHAFAAALYQRLGRHREAIEQYLTALRLAPSAGIWWVGIGISYHALQRQKEALDAFTTAKSAGSLAPELLTFVDQRLRQLQ